MINEREKNAYDQLLQGVQSFVKKCVNESNRDITTTARIVSVQSDGSYNIDLNGVEYKNISTIGGTCKNNEMVKVMIPQGQYNNMFILKGGETSTNIVPSVSSVSSVNGKSGDVILDSKDIGLGNVPNVSTDNQTPSFTQADTLENITSKEKLSIMFGKVSKAIDSLINHFANEDNPHHVTKSQVGLNNVGNFKSVSTVANQGLTETEKKNARDNMGIGRSGIIEFDKIYPIGSIYMSVNNTNPTELFGGTWEQIKDCFLLSSGDVHTAGETGGETVHTLTTDEMPSHSHRDMMWGENSGNYFGVNAYDGGGIWRFEYSANTSQASFYTNRVGGSQPHNNMPPYLVVYVWKRIA